MLTLSGRVLGALSDATIGTAIVMVHLILSERIRAQRVSTAGTNIAPLGPRATQRGS
ncbi:MAG: hypothetical protein JWO36_1087 [Myxococcales bacterium]|nr:hypothetical protein [Myxococcales bacterium]